MSLSDTFYFLLKFILMMAKMYARYTTDVKVVLFYMHFITESLQQPDKLNMEIISINSGGETKSQRCRRTSCVTASYWL